MVLRFCSKSLTPLSAALIPSVKEVTAVPAKIAAAAKGPSPGIIATLEANPKPAAAVPTPASIPEPRPALDFLSLVKAPAICSPCPATNPRPILAINPA